MTVLKRTLSGVPIPPNFSRVNRPPNESGHITPELEEFLTQPRLLERIQLLTDSGHLHPADANQALVALRRHYRSMNGDRARPGEYLGRDDLAHEPMPFAPPEEAHPENAPGTHKGNVMRRAVERMDADRIQDGLLATFRENDPSNSTWARSDPSAGRAASTDTPEPSLRDSIESSVQALGG